MQVSEEVAHRAPDFLRAAELQRHTEALRVQRDRIAAMLDHPVEPGDPVPYWDLAEVGILLGHTTQGGPSASCVQAALRVRLAEVSALLFCLEA